MDIVHQLGRLFLEAVPTVVLLLLFFVFLKWAFFTPVLKAMAERTARIEGARAVAAAVEAEARSEMHAYHEAIKKARAKIFQEQEAARQAVLDERARLLAAMRQRVGEEVGAAKRRVASEFAAARADIERQTPELAAAIARAVVEAPSSLRGSTTIP